MIDVAKFTNNWPLLIELVAIFFFAGIGLGVACGFSYIKTSKLLGKI